MHAAAGDVAWIDQDTTIRFRLHSLPLHLRSDVALGFGHTARDTKSSDDIREAHEF